MGDLPHNRWIGGSVLWWKGVSTSGFKFFPILPLRARVAANLDE
jgi:hypothetical protein